MRPGARAQRGDSARDPGACAVCVPGQEEPVAARGRAGESARQPQCAGRAAGARRQVLPAGACPTCARALNPTLPNPAIPCKIGEGLVRRPAARRGPAAGLPAGAGDTAAARAVAARSQPPRTALASHDRRPESAAPRTDTGRTARACVCFCGSRRGSAWQQAGRRDAPGRSSAVRARGRGRQAWARQPRARRRPQAGRPRMRARQWQRRRQLPAPAV